MQAESTGNASTYREANRRHFDKLVAEEGYLSSRSAQELAKRASKAILESYDFDEDATEILDFACGSGLLSRHLLPHAKSVVGVDISQGMVDLYNANARNQGLLEGEMRAVCFDVLSPEPAGHPLKGQRFDVVVCASAYHHFESIEDVTVALASHLKPSGHLIVVDLIQPEDQADLDELFPGHDGSIVAHRGGFKEETIVQALHRAALEDVEFHAAINVRKKGRNLQLFLAKGRRGAA